MASPVGVCWYPSAYDGSREETGGTVTEITVAECRIIEDAKGILRWTMKPLGVFSDEFSNNYAVFYAEASYELRRIHKFTGYPIISNLRGLADPNTNNWLTPNSAVTPNQIRKLFPELSNVKMPRAILKDWVKDRL